MSSEGRAHGLVHVSNVPMRERKKSRAMPIKFLARETQVTVC